MSATMSDRPLALYIEEPVPVDGAWSIVTHPRYPRCTLPTTEVKYFPTGQDARQWYREMLDEGARIVRTDFKPGALIPRDLPTIRAWKTDEGLSLQIDGQTVAAGIQDTRNLKREIADHPRGHYLNVVACPRCNQKPKVNLIENTLMHTYSVCPIRVTITHWAVPLELKIAAWNLFFAKRYKEIDLQPVTLPQLEEIGIIRPPSNSEMIRKITKVEIL